MTSTPASRSARATSFTPRSCPSSPTFPIKTRKGFAAVIPRLRKRGVSIGCGDRTRSSCLYLFEIIFPFNVLLHISHLYFRIMFENQQPRIFERPLQNPPLRLQGLQGIQIVAHDVWEWQVRHGRDEIAEVERSLAI